MDGNPMNAGENQADSSSLGKKCIVILGVVGVSFSAVLVKNSTAPSMVLVFYRMFLAALLLTVPGLAALRRERSAVTGELLLCCLISGFFLALHFTLYFEAVKYTSIASAVLLVDTEVFFVAFATLFFFREKIPRKAWIGILVTFVGSVIVGMGDAGGGSDAVRGGSLCPARFCLHGCLYNHGEDLPEEPVHDSLHDDRVLGGCSDDHHSAVDTGGPSFRLWRRGDPAGLRHGGALYAAGAQCLQLGAALCQRLLHLYGEAHGTGFCVHSGDSLLPGDPGHIRCGRRSDHSCGHLLLHDSEGSMTGSGSGG